MSTPAESPRYFAFISYSHQDESWAQWLHKTLETWRVPKRLVGQTTDAGVIPPRLLPIFRDRDELASATDLGRTVNAALAQSKNLIVICSPASAKSRWVNEEVLAFKRLGHAERIFCLIVGGEPNASDLAGRDADECFAPALRFQIGGDGQPTSQRTEPIAADAREGKDGKANAKLKLIAGLLDVGFDALKQRELQRRNRRLAIVTAAALVVMAITTTLAITAVIARNDAERRQAQAEDLVGFMLGDLNDKLSQVNRLDIIESVDDKAMGYFKSLPISDVTDEAVVQRAKALERIGSVRLDQGHLPAALESYEAALKLISAQAQAMPQDIARQLAHAENLSFIGMAHWYQGDLDAAARDFSLTRSILARAESIDSANTKLLFQKQIVESNLGHVLESQGDFEAALASYRSALDLAAKLVEAKPDNVEWASRLGDAHNNLGKLALIRGDLVTAVAEYSADDKIETDLGARDPNNNDQRQNVFRVRAILGRTLALVGDTEGAIRRLREAVGIAGQLEKQDPTITSIRANAALYKMQLSRLLRLSGGIDEAATLTSEALVTFAELVRQDASNTSWQREFAEARTERSAQLLSTGSADEAHKLLEDALAWLEPALVDRPNDRETVLATVNTRLLLATTGDDTRAQQLRESCLQSVNVVKSGANDPRLLAVKVNAFLGLGRTNDALPVIERLRTSGYRDPAFVEAMRRSNIAFLPAEQRGTVAPSEATKKGVSGN
ncbi:MAG TPA: TIR domain-containing protein [Rhodanobacteraceae bacterium]|jgi:tetratricopeptide (TPR) repeat protein|nr:TIR domain-containing protein [Rhodanobacteraceae bacterium]